MKRFISSVSDAENEAEEFCKDAMAYCGNQARKFCSKRNLKHRLPITEWLPRYSSQDLLGDVVAGFTVGLTAIPQGMAYAVIAGLPPNYGLYSAFMGCFVYMIFGSCKDITIGPTAIMSIMTHEYAQAGNPDTAVLLSFLTGIIVLLFGCLNLGFLIAFVSRPVIAGFTSAAAVTIATSQLQDLLGMKFHSEGVVDTWIIVFKNIHETRWQDAVLGIACLVVLLYMMKLKDFKRFKPSSGDTMKKKVIKKSIFLVSLARNAIVVLIGTALAGFLDASQPFTITGDVQPGLPTFSLPPFSTNGGNTTFPEMVSAYGTGIIIVPLLAVIENIAIGSAFSHGKTLDATQEMIALGFCNIVGGFCQSMPTTGSFSRTAVNATSGVRTTAGGIVTGVIVILSLSILTPYFKYIPTSALAAVIICSVIFSVELHESIPIWRIHKPDQLVLWTTFICCLFWKLEMGILLGICINVGLLLYGIASPKIYVTTHSEEDKLPTYVSVKARTGLFFPSVDKLCHAVTKAATDDGQGIFPVVVHCASFHGIDYTGARGIASAIKDFEKRKQHIVFVEASPGICRGIRALCPQAHVTGSGHLSDILTREDGASQGGSCQTLSISSQGESIAEGDGVSARYLVQ